MFHTFVNFVISVLPTQLLPGMGQFGAAVSAMDVSAMKCEMYFPLECHQSANFALSS